MHDSIHDEQYILIRITFKKYKNKYLLNILIIIFVIILNQQYIYIYI